MARLNKQSIFVTYMSHQYRKYHVVFYFIDDYLLWVNSKFSGKAGYTKPWCI